MNDIERLVHDYIDAVERGDQDPDTRGAGTPRAEVSNTLIIARRRAEGQDCISGGRSDHLRDSAREMWEALEEGKYDLARELIDNYVLDMGSATDMGVVGEAIIRVDEVHELARSDPRCDILGGELQTLALFFSSNAEGIDSADLEDRSRLAEKVASDLGGAIVRDHNESCVGRKEAVQIQDTFHTLEQEVDTGDADSIREVAQEAARTVRENFGIPFPGHEPDPDGLPDRSVRCVSAPRERDLEEEISRAIEAEDRWPVDLTVTTNAQGELTGCVLLEEIIKDQ